MLPSPPDGVFTHDRPEDIDVNDIDEEVRGAFKLFEEVDGVHTVLTCQGHPESENLYAWGTKLEIRLVYHIDVITEIFEFKDLLLDGTPKKLEDKGPGSKLFNFLSATFRNNNMSWEMYTIESPWQAVVLQYDYSTVGERRCFIRVLEESIREIFLLDE